MTNEMQCVARMSDDGLGWVPMTQWTTDYFYLDDRYEEICNEFPFAHIDIITTTDYKLGTVFNND